ncbi:hypothetical protein FRX31_005947 [Thalictrum thalictroides]|uniref:Uncharacterized protein n=1 Tax=Thalictrum thalictroides TaxID=46969 RepID=A0A7J6X3V7_THATH|nr:hypothetical protein FRX31_005947 [Thalictrum thalictroides]
MSREFFFYLRILRKEATNSSSCPSYSVILPFGSLKERTGLIGRFLIRVFFFFLLYRSKKWMEECVCVKEGA